MKNLQKRILVGFLTAALSFGMLPATPVMADTNYGSTTLRIITTTDLHGQSVTDNYDSASEHYEGSLAQVSTLVNETKSALKYGDTLLVDCGDTVYGYGSESIMNGAVSGSEYMYAEMAAMGYDALTLGNHDFDYGYEYILSELKEAGLNNKVVVSNVYHAKSKKNVWAENKIITKKLKTTRGKEIPVKIGIIGVTTPTLTVHYDYKAILTTKDMVESVKEQVEKLKAKQADVIVVLAHSGIGSEEPALLSQSVGYALSKIDGVDMIAGGHSHTNFPSADEKVEHIYDYPGVTEDGLMNGTAYVQTADRGAGIGIADLKLEYVNGKVKVVGKKTRLKKVTAKTELDSNIVKINKIYQKQLDEIYQTSLGKVDSSINNYFGTLEDNAAVQVMNEAKIRYGLEYIHNVATQYKDLPVITATSYNLVGNESSRNYINIEDDFTIGDSLNVQNWDREFAFIYTISGRQLRQLLEWQASAYQDPSMAQEESWKKRVVSEYVEDRNLNPILNPEWFDDWSSFMVFDGIEYEIDPTQPARYDKAGNIIDAQAKRVTKLTHNGQPITNSTQMVFVGRRFVDSMPVLKSEMGKQLICSDRVFANQMLQDYVTELDRYGSLNITPDHNWRVNFPAGTNYLIKSSSESQELAQAKPWYVSTLDMTEKDAYYQASFGMTQEDTSGPFLAVASGKTKTTNHAIPVIVQASDASGVRYKKYYNGILSADSSLWSGASLVGSSFTVTANGTYSVLAEDNNGNRTVKYLTITNYRADELEMPVVTKCTNRVRQLTGTAEAGTKLYAKAAGSTYQTTVGADGTFACEMPLYAGELVKLWIEDEQGRTSAVLTYEVARTGANLPDVNNLTNKTRHITGNMNDSLYCMIVAFAGKNVYVPKNGGTQAYMESNLYDETKVIIPTDYVAADGEYDMTIPVLNADTKVKVYSVDWIGRKSMATDLVVEGVAPNMPVMIPVYAIDDYVFGKIPAASEGSYTISVDDGTDVYTEMANADGSFAVSVGKLEEGQALTITASDVVDGRERISAKAYASVVSCQALLAAYADVETDITFDEIDSKGLTISGHMNDYSGKINLLIGTTRVIVTADENGDFSYTLSKPRAAGTSIVAMVREEDGSIYDICETTVKLAIPEMPELLNDTLYDTTTELRLFCTDRATAVVKIGKKYYKATECVYDEKRGGYIYTINLKKAPKADTAVIIYMMNKSGKSERIQTVIEVDPTVEVSDQPETVDHLPEP